MAVLVFVGWYYPIGLRQNAMEAGQVAERGALMFLFILTFLIFAGTFTNMVIGWDGGEYYESDVLTFIGLLRVCQIIPSLLLAISISSPQS